MLHPISYLQRRGELEHYFDRTALKAWERLTSTAPVGRIRASVRAGRDEMRSRLLDWLPADLRGRRVLDAGCGTGALALEAARRGAEVVAVDLSPRLLALAQQRLPDDVHANGGSVRFYTGDMLDPTLGQFDHVVAMDSLIHYRMLDVLRVLIELSKRTRQSIAFTIAPRTLPLLAMHAVGRLFPRSDRAPAIEPIALNELHDYVQDVLRTWRCTQAHRVGTGFYKSHALELQPA